MNSCQIQCALRLYRTMLQMSASAREKVLTILRERSGKIQHALVASNLKHLDTRANTPDNTLAALYINTTEVRHVLCAHSRTPSVAHLLFISTASSCIHSQLTFAYTPSHPHPTPRANVHSHLSAPRSHHSSRSLRTFACVLDRRCRLAARRASGDTGLLDDRRRCSS